MEVPNSMTQKAILLPQGKHLLSVRYLLEGGSPHVLNIYPQHTQRSMDANIL